MMAEDRVTHAELMHKLELMHLDLAAQLAYTSGLISQTTSQGVRMSELSQSVDQLQAAVAGLADRLANLPDQSDLLQQLADKQTELDAALADDNADQALIDSLTGERDALLSDAQSNAAEVQQVTEQLKGLAGGEAPPSPQQLPS